MQQGDTVTFVAEYDLGYGRWVSVGPRWKVIEISGEQMFLVPTGGSVEDYPIRVPLEAVATAVDLRHIPHVYLRR